MVNTRDELVARFAGLKVSRAPYPAWPEPGFLADRVLEGGPLELERILGLYRQREQIIERAKTNPFVYGYEWECWRRADDFLPVHPWATGEYNPPLTDTRLLLVFGGNRASKTEWAVKRCLQSALRFPGTRMVFLCQKLETSRQVQQEYTWRMMPPELKALNGRKDPKAVRYISYKKGTGFSDQKVVFSNGSEIVFLVYTQDVDDYEGIQVGCPDHPGVIGWYADESLPLNWLQLMRTRSVTADAVGIWTFTPLRGLTQAIQEARGNGQILESELEPALEGRETLPGLPRGHMPTVQEGASKGISIVYYHSRENPMSGYSRLVSSLAGKPQFMLERGLCGYARESRGRLFTTFGSVHIVKAEDVPQDGTIYMHVDPQSARNWFMLWLKVDREGRVWVIAEWPPEADYGEWAVPTERNPAEEGGLGWDGDAGPAQEVLGWGIAQYKLEMLRVEKDQPVFRRTVDRRAGPAPVPMASGPSTCIWQELGEEQVTHEGVAPAMEFELAGGPSLVDDGLELIKQALWWDSSKPLDPVRNSPRLFVCSHCTQLIWALSRYTGRDGQKGACKDPIDCLRDMFTSGLEYSPKGALGSYGGWNG